WNRRRAGDCGSHHRAPRWPYLGRGQPWSGRHVLVDFAAGLRLSPGLSKWCRYFENLAQVGEKSLVIAQGLAWRVRQFGYRLTVGCGEFHHDADGGETHVVGEVGTDTKSQLGPVAQCT